VLAPPSFYEHKARKESSSMAMRLVVREVRDLSEVRVDLPEGPVVKAVTLEKLIAQIGGLEGYIRDPVSKELRTVSLAAWKDRDPETTWLSVSFDEEQDTVD